MTGLWPALLAALLGHAGRGRLHGGSPPLDDYSSPGDGGSGSTTSMIIFDASTDSPLAHAFTGVNTVYWLIALLCFVALAYSTNPSDTSFRTHLTDLSFHQHLRRIRANEQGGSSSSSTTVGHTLAPPGAYKGDSNTNTSSRSNANTTDDSGRSTPAPAVAKGGSATPASSSSSSSKDKLHTDSSGPSTTKDASTGKQAPTAEALPSSSVPASSSQQASKHKHASASATSTPTVTTTGPPITIGALGKARHTARDGIGRGPFVSGSGNGNGSKHPHILSFSNRVSINLKTPTYVRTNYGFFSTVRILPPPSTSSSSSSSTSAAGKGVNGATMTRASKAPKQLSPDTISTVNGKIIRKRSATPLDSVIASAAGGKRGSHTHRLKSKKTRSRTARSLVSTVMQMFRSTFSFTNPWTNQGGYFVGFLGYWWTIDDGSSSSGARERLRLKSAIISTEVLDTEEENNVQPQNDEASAGASRGPHTPEGGLHANASDPPHHHSNSNQKEHSSNHNSNVTLLDGQTLAQQHHHTNSSASGSGTGSTGPSANPVNAAKQKHLNRLAANNTGSVSMRGGQRRSSPTPRLVQNTKKQQQQQQHGSSKNSSANVSGETTPLTSPTGTSSIHAAASSATTASHATRAQKHDNASSHRHLLSTDSDKNLPGLPFHRDQSMAGGNPHDSVKSSQKAATSVVSNSSKDARAPSRKTVAGDHVVAASHAASAPESQVLAVTPAAIALQSQLDELRASTEATQARLRAELEELRNKKQDEDIVRAELKSRTKGLEEGKRAAEAARLESERKLISARATKKAIEDRVSKARVELGKLEKKEKEVEERTTKARKEREAMLVKMREEVKQRENLLQKEEEATDRLSQRVDTLEIEIADRKAELQVLRDEAAYAAQQHQHQHQHQYHPHGSHHGQNRLRMSGGRAASGGHAREAAHAAANANHHRLQHHPASAPSPNLPALFDGPGAGKAGSMYAPGYAYYGQQMPFDEHFPGPHHQPPSPSHTPPSFPSSATTFNAPGSLHPAQGPSLGKKAFPPQQQQSQRKLGSGRAASNPPPTTSANPNVAADPNANNVLNSLGVGIPSKSMSSGIDSSVVGSSSTAAPALHDRGFHVGHAAGRSDGETETVGPMLGSTFAPFGPPNPMSPPTGDNGSRITESNGATANSSLVPAPSAHLGYFLPDSLGQGASGSGTLDKSLSTFDSKPGSTRTPRAAGTGPDSDNEDALSSSMLSEGGGPLSPMTPHQASLIPSQLFDLFDEVDVDLPASPSPALHGSNDSTRSKTQGLEDDSRPTDARSGRESPTSMVQHKRHVSNPSTSGTNSRAAAGVVTGAAGIWNDFDDGFDLLDKPLYQSSLSRHTSLMNRGRVSPSASSAFDAVTNSTGHGSHGGGAFTTTHSSSSGSISPLLTHHSGAGTTSSAAHAFAQQQQQQHLISTLGGGGGKSSPNDLYRRALALNPDAEAFSFNRPLPASSSATSLRSGGHGINSNHSDATRLAFESTGTTTIGNSGKHASHSSLDILPSSSGGSEGATGAANAAATWAPSPIPGSRALVSPTTASAFGAATASGQHAATSSLDAAVPTAAAASSGHGQRSASGPIPGSTFSPFDDDELLRGW